MSLKLKFYGWNGLAELGDAGESEFCNNLQAVMTARFSHSLTSTRCEFAPGTSTDTDSSGSLAFYVVVYMTDVLLEEAHQEALSIQSVPLKVIVRHMTFISQEAHSRARTTSPTRVPTDSPTVSPSISPTQCCDCLTPGEDCTIM